jgi:hypothetical protein
VPSGLTDIIRAKFPLSIGFEDLGAGWRVLNWRSQNYFTKGESTFLGTNEYLVVYRESTATVGALTPTEYAFYVTRNQVPNILKGNARFAISLLPMADVQRSLTDGQTNLRSYDPSDYLPGTANAKSEAFNQNLSLVYLRKIGDAFSAYSAANLAVLPPLDTAFAARQSLEAYAENPAIFTQPGTANPFKYNPILSGRKRAHLRGKNSWVLAYEGEAASDGSRGVLRLGGSVMRVSEKTWLKMKEASMIE